jgi:hypothetical protein
MNEPPTTWATSKIIKREREREREREKIKNKIK